MDDGDKKINPWNTHELREEERERRGGQLKLGYGKACGLRKMAEKGALGQART